MPKRTDYKMNLDIPTYQKINNSFRKRLIYHSGIDCGFFVELNYMLNAMLYCLEKGYRFQLYSEDANYGTGYYHQEFNRLAPQERKDAIIRLLASVDILLHSRAFIGTITSGPSVFIMKVRADEPSVTAIDCLREMLPDCLSLTIDERATISREMMTR